MRPSDNSAKTRSGWCVDILSIHLWSGSDCAILAGLPRWSSTGHPTSAQRQGHTALALFLPFIPILFLRDIQQLPVIGVIFCISTHSDRTPTASFRPEGYAGQVPRYSTSSRDPTNGVSYPRKHNYESGGIVGESGWADWGHRATWTELRWGDGRWCSRVEMVSG